MLNHAKFTSYLLHDVIVIFDIGKDSISVTNDIEYVLRKVRFEIADSKPRKVIYRDSAGTFDEVVIDDEFNFKNFKSLDEKELSSAIKKLKKIYRI